jgi:hypothetical protein
MIDPVLLVLSAKHKIPVIHCDDLGSPLEKGVIGGETHFQFQPEGGGKPKPVANGKRLFVECVNDGVRSAVMPDLCNLAAEDIPDLDRQAWTAGFSQAMSLHIASTTSASYIKGQQDFQDVGLCLSLDARGQWLLDCTKAFPHSKDTLVIVKALLRQGRPPDEMSFRGLRSAVAMLDSLEKLHLLRLRFPDRATWRRSLMVRWDRVSGYDSVRSKMEQAPPAPLPKAETVRGISIE